MTPNPQVPTTVSVPGAVITIVLLALFVTGISTLWPLIAPLVAELSTVQMGLLASLVAGLFTAVGAIPIFFLYRISRGLEDSFMGFGAGVMLAATAFELVLPAVTQAEMDTGSPALASGILAIGMGLGGGIMLVMHRLVPHEHFLLGPQSGGDTAKMRRVWLFIFAIALHNLPEGLAVGVGFGGDVSDGVALAIGIGLQNMPEGLVVAIALMALGYTRRVAFGVTLLTGLVQPLGGVVGAGAVSLVAALMPWALAFAAGAMLFVISHEIIPESHRAGHEGKATFGVLLGFVVMLAIDVMLG